MPAGTLRTSTITFRQLRSATIARNAIHGLDFQPLTGPSCVMVSWSCRDLSLNHAMVHSGNAPPRTRIRTAYQPAVQAHAIRDWLAKHPKIVFPVVLFLLGTLTYTVCSHLALTWLQSFNGYSFLRFLTRYEHTWSRAK